MWKFFEVDREKVVPNTTTPTHMVCDAFVAVVRQTPPGRMTVLAAVGESKSLMGKPRERVLRAVRFSKEDAAATAAFAAEQVTQLYERISPEDDRLWQAISSARNGELAALQALDPAVTARKAPQANDAAAYAAESARSAVLAAMAPDDGIALQATGYAIAYAIQAADKVGAEPNVTSAIEKWLLTRQSNLKTVRA
jgi:hypothetical protein